MKLHLPLLLRRALLHSICIAGALCAGVAAAAVYDGNVQTMYDLGSGVTTGEDLELINGVRVVLGSVAGVSNMFVDDGNSVGTIWLGNSTMVFDSQTASPVYYNSTGGYTDPSMGGYTIRVMDDAARIRVGSNQFLTIADLSGVAGSQSTEAAYHDVTIQGNARSMLIKKASSLRNLNITGGQVILGEGDGMTGSVNGNLLVGGKSFVTLGADNVMTGKGGATLTVSTQLQLGNTTQTFADGSAIELENGRISGESEGRGLVVADGAAVGVRYSAAENVISANLNVGNGATLNILNAGLGSFTDNVLQINGVLSGGGNLSVGSDVSGSVGMVELRGSNTAYSGNVTVAEGSVLSLNHAQALGGAESLTMNAGSYLYVNTADASSVHLQHLTLDSGATLALQNVSSSYEPNAELAALSVDSITFANSGQVDKPVYYVMFGEELQTMRTFSLISSMSEMSPSGLAQVDVRVKAADGKLAQLAVDDYKLGVYKLGSGENVFYLQTRFGNVWDGAESGTWNGNNWEGSAYNAEKFNYALFVNKGAGVSTVDLGRETVNPDKIYVDNSPAEQGVGLTHYVITNGRIGAGVEIHKQGDSYGSSTVGTVEFSGVKGGSATDALGWVTVSGGEMKLTNGSEFYFDGSKMVQVDADSALTINTSSKLIARNGNTISGVSGHTMAYANGLTAYLSGLKISDDTILGGISDGYDTVVQDASISGFTIKDVKLAGAGTIHNGRLEDVVLAENADWCLTGNIAISDTLKVDGNGSGVYIEFKGNCSLDFGGVEYTKVGDVYTFDVIQGVNHVYGFEAGILSYNGVKLSDIKGARVNVPSSGSYLGRVELDMSGTGMKIVSWDAAWAASGVGAQPTFVKTFSTGDSTAFVRDDNYKSFISTEEKPVTVVSVESSAKGEVLAGGTAGYQGDIWINDDGSTYTTKVAALYRTTEELTGDSHLQIAGGSGTDVYGSSVGVDPINKANHTGDTYVTITGGSYTNVYGGGSNVNHTGDTRVYVHDGATVTNVYGGSAGTSTDNGLAEIFLEGGTITNVYGAGSSTSEFTGRTFTEDTVLNGVTIRAGETVSSIIHLSADVEGLALLDGDAYGDRETSSSATAGDNHPNGKHILHFTDAAFYDMSQSLGETSGGTTIRDFTDIVLAEDAYVKANHLFSMDNYYTPSFENNEVVTISGKGTVELIGLLKPFAPDTRPSGEPDSARTIYLEDNARLYLNTDNLGKWASSSITPSQIVHVSDGTTLETTGNPLREVGSNLHMHLYAEGDGVDGKGAWYKGVSSSVDDGSHAEMGHITLTNDASVGGEGNMYVNAYGYTNSVIDLTDGTLQYETLNNGDASKFVGVEIGSGNYTFSKVGSNMLGLKNTHIVGGTLNIVEGAINVTSIADGDAVKPWSDAQTTDVVIGKQGSLQLDYMTGTGDDSYNHFTVASLSGEGTVELQEHGSIDIRVVNSAYYSEFLNQDSISKWNSEGYAYAVYSGAITSESGGLVTKSGPGVQYLTGSHSTYGSDAEGFEGTWVSRGTLYLEGDSTATVFEQGRTEVKEGVIGVGTLYWYDGVRTPEMGDVYLGDGVRIFNTGAVTLGHTTYAEWQATERGKDGYVEMTIGVEAAPNGENLGRENAAKYLILQENPTTGEFAHSVLTVNGKEYVQINTANLSSISIDAMYMDGTVYTAGDTIDRTKMLLVAAEVWNNGELDATVKGLNSGGYNEATYSGVLTDGVAEDGMLVKGKLVKVGEGTLVIDQANTYSGGTDVTEGSIKLLGWATMGVNAATNEVNMLQESGASIVLAYDGSYGETEQREIFNDLTLKGKGDLRWDVSATEGTDGETAALISDVGAGVDFLLDGAIHGEGNLLHSGEGTLTLNGASDYTLGTIITRSSVTVTSATGLGATAEGKEAILKLYEGAILRLATGAVNSTGERVLRGNQKRIDHATVTGDAKLNAGITQWMVTELAADTADGYSGNSVKGAIVIEGAADVERVLAMSGNGYWAESTNLTDYNATLVFADEAATNMGGDAGNGAGILTGNGTIAVSDIDTIGEKDAQSTVYAYFSKMDGYTGSVVVEGTGAQLEVGKVSGGRGQWVGEFINSQTAYVVKAGVTDSVGQVSVSGQGAEFTASSADIFVTDGSSLSLTSNGHAESGGVGSVASVTANNVIIETGATFCVNQSATDFQYQLKELEAAAVLKPTDIANNAVLNGYGYTRGENLGFEGASGYEFAYDKNIAVNQAAVGAVCRGDSAGGRLGFQGRATYEATKGNANLCDGLLTLDVYDGLIKLDFVPDKDLYTIASANEDKRVQLVLFSGVNSVHFCSMDFDSKFTTSGGNVYYTMASNYFENEYIELYNPYLVFDTSAGIVYMDFMVPEPTTTTLGILALAALAARRRRR